MYVCACLLHAYAYSKYAYTYNWIVHASPMYAHMYLCLETLIRAFFAYVSLFYLRNMPLFELFFTSISLCFSVFLVSSPLCQLGF